MSPRVKLVYQEYGAWAEAVAQPGSCKHPRERLRYDGSFAFPCYLYCRDCGTRYIHRNYGLTTRQLKRQKKHARRIKRRYAHLFDEGDNDAIQGS